MDWITPDPTVYKRTKFNSLDSADTTTTRGEKISGNLKSKLKT